MTQYRRGNIVTLLGQGRVALDNALNVPEILDALAAFNYDAPKLQEGRALLLTLEERHAAQLRLHARQKEATAAFRATWDEAHRMYVRHVKIARALLAGWPERLARLGLEGRRARTFGSWLEQVRQFYREGLADAELQALLEEGGLTPAVLASGQASVQAAIQADRARESARGLAQQSTQDRNAAAAAFHRWMRNFWKIAEVALSDRPQWLERLGRLVRS